MYLRGLSFDDCKNFNLVLTDGGIISLENNIPCQFFDPASQKLNIPRGYINAVGVPGQKKISYDHQKYLDRTRVGRLHHFMSLSDITYW